GGAVDAGIGAGDDHRQDQSPGRDRRRLRLRLGRPCLSVRALSHADRLLTGIAKALMANDFAVVSSVNTRFLLGPCIGVFELIANLRKRQYTLSVRMLPADRQTAVASGRDPR